LPASFARQWSARPQAAALIDAADGRLVTAAELESLSRQRAHELLARGLAAGDRLLVSPGAPLESAVVVVAALRAGLVLVPVNPQSTAAELRHIMAETKPAACAPGSAALGGAVAEIDPSVQRVGDGAVVTRPPAASRSGGTVAGALDASGPGDAALILFTSGTTGRPKGAVHSHGSLWANAEALREAWRWSPDDRLVHALPMFHAHGLCVGLLGTLHAGAAAVLLPRFGVPEVLGACARFRATLFFGVPTMYHRLHASGRAGELGSLRLAVSGSAALPAALHVAIAAASGMAILERYGTTETLMSLSNPYDGERRAGTVGFPLPGVEIRLLATASPAASPAAAGGALHDELLVRGPALFTGYLGRPAETAEAFDDGWYRTGDIARVDEDGYVRILGRTKELVISGGFNVYPAEVEDVLAEHPGVAQVAVTGTPSAEWGEVVTAWIVPSGDSDGLVAAITAFAAQRLAPYKCPRIVHLVASLPRNALGKVVKHELDSGA
jgi:malonyl-CoA/methylmalonyl-CoA synthetase